MAYENFSEPRFAEDEEIGDDLMEDDGAVEEELEDDDLGIEEIGGGEEE